MRGSSSVKMTGIITVLLILYHDTNVQTVHNTLLHSWCVCSNTNVPVLLYVQIQYVCTVIRVRINPVRLPNLLVVS